MITFQLNRQIADRFAGDLFDNFNGTGGDPLSDAVHEIYNAIYFALPDSKAEHNIALTISEACAEQVLIMLNNTIAHIEEENRDVDPEWLQDTHAVINAMQATK